jgi:hypothetical protein
MRRDSGCGSACAITRDVEQRHGRLQPMPHPNECLKVGACLDELNAPFVETRQPPRRMTPEQANAAMAALREGKTLKRAKPLAYFGAC